MSKSQLLIAAHWAIPAVQYFQRIRPSGPGCWEHPVRPVETVKLDDHLVICYIANWKIHPFLIGKPSISMGHLYHGELLNYQRVDLDWISGNLDEWWEVVHQSISIFRNTQVVRSCNLRPKICSEYATTWTPGRSNDVDVAAGSRKAALSA